MTPARIRPYLPLSQKFENFHPFSRTILNASLTGHFSTSLLWWRKAGPCTARMQEPHGRLSIELLSFSASHMGMRFQTRGRERTQEAEGISHISLRVA
jgi:hypothetical protein